LPQRGSELYRSLAGLEKTASTSRVLNLAALSLKHRFDPNHQRRPLFHSRALNSALVLKHRLRANEVASFPISKQTATKVIVPFERSELRLGGRSFFVGEPGWVEGVFAIASGGQDAARDTQVLEAVDELPSLDPFLLREHLKRRGFDVSPSYFEISAIDLQNMQRFVGDEVKRLIEMAFDDASGAETSTKRLVDMLLHNAADPRFDNLRRTLRLEGEGYLEGIFAWRGFLYYKWVLADLWPHVHGVLDEIARVKAVGPQFREYESTLKQMKLRVHDNVQRKIETVRGYLQLYDYAFSEMTAHHDATAFRDFLMNSPQLFLRLGEGCGMLSHIVTFWRYRFTSERRLQASAAELVSIFTDFESGLGDDAADQFARRHRRLPVA